MGRLNTGKMPALPRLMYRFNAILISLPQDVFVDTEKIILKFIWKGKGARIGKTILQKNKMEEASLLSFTTYYTGTVIKTMWFFKPLGKPSAVQWDLLGPCISLATLPAPRCCGTAASPQSVLGEAPGRTDRVCT